MEIRLQNIARDMLTDFKNIHLCACFSEEVEAHKINMTSKIISQQSTECERAFCGWCIWMTLI